MPLEIIRNLDMFTNAIEVAVDRADWSEAVRAAEARSRFLIALAPDQPDEVRAALGKMQETDMRISIAARETLVALVTESWIAQGGTRLTTQAFAAKSLSRTVDDMVCRHPFFSHMSIAVRVMRILNTCRAFGSLSRATFWLRDATSKAYQLCRCDWVVRRWRP